MSKTKKMVLAAFFIALGLVLPFLTGQLKQVGSMLLPMHLPILLCGFVCGPAYGLIAGFITPLLRSVLFSMPPIYQAIAMAFELAVYGLVVGFMNRLLAKRGLGGIYASLLTAMVLGRVVWGIVRYVQTMGSGDAFTASMFLSGAVLTAIPGILLQLVLIPIIVSYLKKGGYIE